jgi:sulfur-carrier protein
MHDTRPVSSPAPLIDDSATDLIDVHLFAAARSAAGADRMQVAPGVLADVLAACERQAPGLREVLPRCSYLVNGVATIDEAARLLGGDRLDVLPPFAGG